MIMKHRFLLWLFILILFLGLTKVADAASYDYDLSIGPSDISFSSDVLIAGATARIYATVHNIGNRDILGYVSFLKGAELLGNSQAISVLPGKSDDVFVDFTVPESSFNVQAKIQGTEPTDQNPANNETQSKLIYPEHDTDSDGVVDSQDADDDNDGLSDAQEFDDKCPYRLKADSDNDGVKDGSDAFFCNTQEIKDTDHDGLGDNADIDDDNDGWSDAEELAKGTDPLRADTDGDGVLDPQDAYPLDASKSQVERNIFQPPAENQPKTEAKSTIDNKQTLPQTGAELEPITRQVKEMLESDKETTQDSQGANADENRAVVEKLAHAELPFFRPASWLLWLIVLLVAVIAVIIIFIFRWYKNRPPESQNIPKDEPVKEIAVQKTTVKVHQPVEPPPSETYKSSSHLLDLKKMIKKK